MYGPSGVIFMLSNGAFLTLFDNIWPGILQLSSKRAGD